MSAKEEREKSLKEQYIEARNKYHGPDDTFSFEMLQKLHIMAKEDVYPDNKFGDIEVSVWSLFRH